MMRESPDRLQMVFIIVVALAAVAVALIGSHIVDSSYEHVKEIKKTNIEESSDDISIDIVKSADDAKTILAKTTGAPNELRFTDQTITRADLRLFVEKPSYTKLKILRCDFDSKDFDILKDSQIKVISMSDVPVDKTLIDYFAAIPKLGTIEMFRCAINPNALGNLAVSKVRLVKFRKCGENSDRIFTRALVKDLARMESLVHAELSKNTFEEGALEAFAGAKCLVLNVSKTNASDSDLETFTRLPRLQYLDVDDCASITCKGLKELEQSSTLKQVRTTVPASSCSFSGAAISKFQHNHYRVPDEYQFEHD